MPLPPISVLLEPVTCMPTWIGKFASLPTTIVRSGCAVNAAGNVPCDPAKMASDASAKLRVPVSVEAYTLARYMQTEVGNRSVAERVAVAQDALNRVRYVETRTGSIVNLLLYRQAAGHPNRGFYGPIHGKTDGVVDAGKAPYGRWAATSQDPSVANVMLAVAILSGDIPTDFNKGADDQYGPEILIKKYGLTSMQNGVRSHGARRDYWVGPLPGVDHFRTFQYRHVEDLDPKSQLGQQLINRGVAAVSGSRPNWTGLKSCGSTGTDNVGVDPKTAAIVIGGSVIAAGAVIGATLWRKRPTPIV